MDERRRRILRSIERRGGYVLVRVYEQDGDEVERVSGSVYRADARLGGELTSAGGATDLVARRGADGTY